jgi:hypothetical protein
MVNVHARCYRVTSANPIARASVVLEYVCIGTSCLWISLVKVRTHGLAKTTCRPCPQHLSRLNYSGLAAVRVEFVEWALPLAPASATSIRSFRLSVNLGFWALHSPVLAEKCHPCRDQPVDRITSPAAEPRGALPRLARPCRTCESVRHSHSLCEVSMGAHSITCVSLCWPKNAVRSGISGSARIAQ